MTANWKDQKKGSKSYYHTIRLRFLWVFLVPLIAIVMMFSVTYMTVRNQIIIASNNTLHQFFRYVDSATEEADDLCVTISCASDFQQYSKLIVENPERYTFYLSKVQQWLTSHGSDKYYDIFVYYPEIDRIVSGIHGTLNLDRYGQVYYLSEDDGFQDAFRAIAQSKEKKPTWYGLSDGDKKDYLCVSMRQSLYRSNKYDCIVVVVLNPDYVTKWIDAADDDAINGVFFINNSNGDSLFSNGPEGTGQEFADSHMILTEYSGDKDIGYSYAIPYAYFNRKMRSLWMIAGVSISLLLVAGLYTIWKQTRKAYQPIENVINILEQQGATAYDDHAYSEFEYLKKVVDKKREDIEDLSRNVRKGNKAKIENFILSLLNGNVRNPGSAENIFQDNGISLCSDQFYVMAFHCEQGEKTDERILFFALSNVMEEIFNRNNRAYMVPVKNNLFVMLVNSNPKEQQENLYQILNEGLDFLEEYVELTFTVGVSNLQVGMSSIHIAYEEALLALKYRLLLGEEIIIYYSDIASRKYEGIQSSDLEMLQLVTTWLSGEASCTAADALVDKIFEKCKIDHNSSIEMVEYFKYDAITMFKRLLMHEGLWSEEWKHRLIPFFSQGSLTNFHKLFSDLLTALSEEKSKKHQDMDVCVKVREYIEQHYSEEQLTVALLGDMIGVDSSYLSKKFKEKYDCTIFEYITKIRINHAKEQLKGTSLCIKDIAQKNGFVNSNSFIRTFKRNEGLTPGAYRDMLAQ